MSNLNETFVDKVVQNCFDLYNRLPKSGKPIEKEWTVLSCFIKYDVTNESTEVVSLGTGSKCIGATKMSPKGDLLNDSHAEIFARRGFLIYLYDNISKAMKGEASIFINENEQLKLKDNIQFIFYSSQLPCGDASIIPKSGEEELYGDVLKPQKRPAEEENESVIKRQKLENDIYRTGAKCLPHCEQDPKEAGIDYHLLGQVRTKPGRGDRTLSVSCSDKIAKWVHLGVQGSLIDIISGPIYIKYFIFGAGVPYSEESLHRALLTRDSEPSIELDIKPDFYQSSLVFPYVKNDDNIRAAAGSIVWVKCNAHGLIKADPGFGSVSFGMQLGLPDGREIQDCSIIATGLSEVAVQGRKLGLTKKRAVVPSSSLCISKYNVYKKFINILDINPTLKRRICDQDDVNRIPYNVMKRKSTRYMQKWLEVKNKFFKTWSVKPDMWDFCINVE